MTSIYQIIRDLGSKVSPRRILSSTKATNKGAGRNLWLALFKAGLFWYLLTFVLMNVVFYVLSPWLDPTAAKYLVLARDALAWIMLAGFGMLYVYKNRLRFPALVWAIFGLWIYLTASLFFSDKSFGSLFYFRAFVQPWALFVLGYFVASLFNFNLQRWLMLTFWIIVIYGLGSWLVFAFPHVFLSHTLLELYGKIAMRRYDLTFQVFGNAISYELVGLVGLPVVRLYGLMFDPPISGVFLGMASVYLFSKRKITAILLVPAIVAGILTLSKGFLFLYIGTVAGMIILWGLSLILRPSVFYKIVWLGILGVLLTMVFISLAATILGPRWITTSVYNHSLGLVNIWKVILHSPLGTGLGTQGNFGPAEALVKESFWGAFIGQFGFMGLFWVGFLLYGLVKIFLEVLRNFGFSEFSAFALYILLVFLSAFLSESSFAIRGVALSFFVYGILYAKIVNKLR